VSYPQYAKVLIDLFVKTFGEPVAFLKMVIKPGLAFPLTVPPEFATARSPFFGLIAQETGL
jgi:hypothetical protein